MGIEERYIYFGFHCFVDFTKAFDTLDLFSGSMVCSQRELRRFQSNYNGMQKRLKCMRVCSLSVIPAGFCHSLRIHYSIMILPLQTKQLAVHLLKVSCSQYYIILSTMPYGNHLFSFLLKLTIKHLNSRGLIYVLPYGNHLFSFLFKLTIKHLNSRGLIYAYFFTLPFNVQH